MIMDNAATAVVDAPLLIVPIFIPHLGCPFTKELWQRALVNSSGSLKW